MPRESQQNGHGVDRSGGPVIDPTENVIALVKAENRRQDDLRMASEKLNEAQNAHIKEIADLQSAHQKAIGSMRECHAGELRKAEADRLDSIRQVDREDVNKTAAQALSAIQTLASTTSITAETLRTQVATTAQATATTLTNITGEINKRLSALELSSSEGKGKQAVSDPAMEQFIQRVDSLLLTRAGAVGGAAAREKSSDNAKWIIGIAIAIGLAAMGWIMRH